MIYAGTHYICKGHLFNGDFALYIAQAESLLNGTQGKILVDMKKMIELSTYQYYSPQLYPWGVPLLLMLPTYLFGINYLAYKCLFFVILLLVIVVLFKDLHLRKEIPVCIPVLLLTGLNPAINQSIIFVISTIPFMFFLYLSLYLSHQIYIKGSTTNRRTIFIYCLLGVVLFMVIQTRTEGFLILPALFIEQIWFIFKKKHTTKKDILCGFIPYAIVCMLFLITLPLFPIGFNTYSSLATGLKLNISENFIFYLKEIPNLCLAFLQGKGVFSIYFFWVFVIIGFLKSSKYILVDKIYMIFYFSALILCWPFEKTRFIIPLIPLLLYFLMNGILSSLRYLISLKWQIWVYRIVVVLCIGSQIPCWLIAMAKNEFKYNDFNMNVDSANAQNMLNFIKKNTKKEDIIGCCESRAVYLYTGRLSCNLSTSVEDTRRKADWYIEFNNRENYLQFFPEDLTYNWEVFKPVYENTEFTIYKIIK